MPMYITENRVSAMKRVPDEYLCVMCEEALRVFVENEQGRLTPTLDDYCKECLAEHERQNQEEERIRLMVEAVQELQHDHTEVLPSSRTELVSLLLGNLAEAAREYGNQEMANVLVAIAQSAGLSE